MMAFTYHPRPAHSANLFFSSPCGGASQKQRFLDVAPANVHVADLKTKIDLSSILTARKAVDQLIRRLILPMRASYDPQTIMPWGAACLVAATPLAFATPAAERKGHLCVYNHI